MVFAKALAGYRKSCHLISRTKICASVGPNLAGNALCMSHERLNILLIEHDPGFTRTVGEMIGQAREVYADVSSASGLGEGFFAISNQHFDVVVLDVALPDGAGLANISLLKAEAPRLPIIAAGDADNETVAVEAVQAGAQDYLVKGQLTPGWLERSIRYAIERHRMDVTLQAAEEKYHSIFDHLIEGIFQTTPEGRYLLANIALARIYGYNTPQELMDSVTDIGRRLYVEEGRRDEFVRLMHEQDTIAGFESQIYRKDGSVIWISENCHARRSTRGELLYYEGTVEDITQRKQTEENLKNSEALYHSLVETIPQNIFRKDTQGNFIFANQQFCKLLGIKLEDIVGKSDFDFFPTDLAEKYRRDDWHVLETGQPFTTIEEVQSQGSERFFVQVVKTPLYEANGRIIGLQGMFWDITKQRQMEENLRTSEALYHSLVETIPQNIFRKDLKGRYTFVNRQFCKTLGKTRDEVLGKTIADFLPENLAKDREADDRKVMETRRPFEAIEESKFSGERGYNQVVKMPIFNAEGDVIGLQGMFWDITAQKMAAERIRKANTELARSRKELHSKNLELEDDLKMAREIQITMLPQQYPSFPKTATPEESAFHFTHRYLPTGAVGGDFFTVSALSDEEASVFICDVAGHGVRSSLVTAMIRALLEELKPLAHDPGQFFTKLNRDLHAILKHAGTPMLTTGFYLVADWKTGIIRYTNAGHPKPLLVRRNKKVVEPLTNIGGKSQPALGLFEEAIYKTSEVKFSPHDLVMLFTDGLYEVQDEAHELYSQSMLVTDVEKRAQLSPSDLFDQLIERMQRFSADGKFSDDVCLVGIEADANLGVRS
jgi:sigma-B regulation protein RsbU (phosphoserine phosphatase)